MGKCNYCDGWSVSAGGPCRTSPLGTHVVDDGPNRCIYCDLYYASSQAECRLSPTGYHRLGTEKNSPPIYDSATPAFIWVSILTVFGILSLPLLYIFHWDINTTPEKIILLIVFLLSLYIGFRFASLIIKIIGYILGGAFSIIILYYIVRWIFKI